MSRTVNRADNYMSQVLKHIPSEIVMAYISIEGVLRTTYNPNLWADRLMLSKLSWGIAGILTFLTPLWLYRVMGVKRLPQLFISTLSVPIWLFALGGPFNLLGDLEEINIPFRSGRTRGIAPTGSRRRGGSRARPCAYG